MKKIYLVFLTVSTLLFYNCSSSENENLSKTFLEKFESKIWRFPRSSNIRYFVFKNNTKNPLTIYTKNDFSNSETCYFIFNDYNSENNVQIILLEENKMELRIGNEDDYFIATFISSGDELNYNGRESYFNQISESNFDLIETSLTESELIPICQ